MRPDLRWNVYGPLTRTYVELATNGSTVGHLRLGQVYSLPLIRCPLTEQKAIVRQVNSALEELTKIESAARAEVAILREYHTRLIADVVTGKLDVREAAARLAEETDETEPLDVLDLPDDELDGLDADELEAELAEAVT